MSLKSNDTCPDKGHTEEIMDAWRNRQHDDREEHHKQGTWAVLEAREAKPLRERHPAD
jgi:hypothetical protein